MLYLDREQTVKLHNHQLTREENSKLLFNLINSSDTVTRAELVRITGLSPSTVSSLVDDLVRAELVTEVGLARMLTGAGRRPIMLNVQPSGRQIPVFSLSRWGVSYTLFDLGYNIVEQNFRPCIVGSNAEAEWPIALDAANDSGALYTEIIEDILTNQSEKFDISRAVAVLISYPGVYLEEDRAFILTSLQTSFRRESIDALEKKLGLPIFMGNSSMSLAYAEKKHHDVGGTKLDDLIYINICDGVGAGIICDGEMFMRPDRIAGEIGHVTVEIGGRPCSCGNCGCLERYVNVDAIINTVREAVGRDRSGTHAEALRSLLENPTLEKIGQAYDAGIGSVCAALDDIAEKLFAGIYSAVNVTGIRCVVIGGLERMGEGFLKKLRSFLSGRRGQVLMRGVNIQYSRIGAQADSIGIAQYYIDKIFTITT